MIQFARLVTDFCYFSIEIKASISIDHRDIPINLYQILINAIVKKKTTYWQSITLLYKCLFIIRIPGFQSWRWNHFNKIRMKVRKCQILIEKRKQPGKTIRQKKVLKTMASKKLSNCSEQIFCLRHFSHCLSLFLFAVTQSWNNYTL